jgi:hypothetical protein
MTPPSPATGHACRSADSCPTSSARESELTLHGQPWARFRLRSFTGASDGAEPVELARWAGTLDGKGRASFALERLRGGVLLLLELEQLPGGRFGALELPVPQK